jgi:hypothetical protein
MSYPHPSHDPSESKEAFRSASDEVGEAIELLLSAGELTAEQRIEVLGGLLAVEVLRPYWRRNRFPDDAQESLRQDDPDLAAVLEALAPVLLGRAQAREDAAAAVAHVETLFG